MSAEDDATIRQGPAKPRLKAVPPPPVEWGRPAAAAPVAARPVGLGWVLLGGVALVVVGLGAWRLALTPIAPVAVAPVAVAPVQVAPAPPIAALPATPPAIPATPDIGLPQSSLPGRPVQQAAPSPDGAPAVSPSGALGSRLASLPPLLDEAAIRAHRAPQPAVLRLATAPGVFVLDYPTLDEQGAALNRVAALLEKAGLPRDRVLSPAELADAIARNGDTPATFYFGHNYRGHDLARFFETAERDGQALSPEEEWVRNQWQRARALLPAGQDFVLISVAAPGPLMDEAGRATILHHEISHGLFGTSPAYAAHIRQVWHEHFTEADRAALRGFLGREGYDTGIEELMIDEAQAYLLHTADPRFFSPAHLGLDAAQVERLRGLMRDGLPQP